MADIIFALNETQFQKILGAQHNWWPVASVFVSALLAMIVGIALERLRSWFDRRKATFEKQEHEIQQINAVISGLTFDLELLLHIASQNILPHYKDSQTIKGNLNDNLESIAQLITALPKYPSLFMTCPEIYLLEYDFAKELPFVIEKDAELVKHSGWLVNGVREIKDVTSRRNRHIESAMAAIDYQVGVQNLQNFVSIVRTQASLATTECIVASQLFQVLLRLIRTLEKINDDYKISAKKSKVKTPDALTATMDELKAISEKVPIRG